MNASDDETRTFILDFIEADRIGGYSVERAQKWKTIGGLRCQLVTLHFLDKGGRRFATWQGWQSTQAINDTRADDEMREEITNDPVIGQPKRPFWKKFTG